MGHGIELPIDAVVSTVGTEWHGLARCEQEINDKIAEQFLFEIVSGEILVKIGDDIVRMKNHKPLIADFRKCRPDLTSSEDTSAGLVPLHIPKNSYRPIENREVWNAMQESLSDLDAKITSIGTLEGGKKFFISASLNKGEKLKVNNDEFLSNLNFITSHDGSLGVEAYDSMIRVICSNTLRWSREAAGEVGFKVWHTQNAQFAMKNLGELVNRVLTGRANFKESMEYLSQCQMKSGEFESFVGGYFASQPTFDENEGLSTRARNSIEEITNLFSNGIGTHGKTRYDGLNAITEYWTSGDGTGKRADKMEKMYKATFGKAADHKNDLCVALLSDNRVKELIKLGKQFN